MTVIAHLKPRSSIAKKWRGEARVGGVIHGAHFQWQFGNSYATGPLAAEQEVLLAGYEVVTLELVDEPSPSQPAAAELPPPRSVADTLEPRAGSDEAGRPGWRWRGPDAYPCGARRGLQTPRRGSASGQSTISPAEALK
jgi:hypothetical protein